MRRTTTLTALACLACLAWLSVAPSPTAIALAAETCDGKVATIVVAESASAPGAPPVQGTAGDDVIVGSAGNDTILGLGGNDTICGLAGSDDLFGGEGDDRLFGGLDFYDGEDYDGDHVAPGPGNDHVDLGHDPVTVDIGWRDLRWDQVSYVDAARGVTVDLAAGTATGEGTDTIAPIVRAGGVEGTRFDDRVEGSDEIDWITAGGGDDVVDGRNGDDVIWADALTRRGSVGAVQVPGNDIVDGGVGHDRIEGGHGNDILRGGRGRDDILVTDATHDTRVSGGAGRDSLGTSPSRATGKARFLGGEGPDNVHPSIASRRDRVRVDGGAGRNRLAPHVSLKAAPRRSKVVIDARSGLMTMKAAKPITFSRITTFDVVGSTATRLVWQGSPRSEILGLTEQSGPVRAFGRGGNDRLFGGSGRDLLDGGQGRDLLFGDDGRDRCLRGESHTSCEVRR